MKYRFVSKNLDFVGFCLSFFCAMHCAIRPFILSLAPLAELRKFNNPMVEFGIMMVSFLIASYIGIGVCCLDQVFYA